MIRLASDEQMHLKLGALAALMLMLVAFVAAYVSPALAILIGGGALAWGVERYQAIRGEGTPSYRDMALSAAPSVLLAAVVFFFH